MGGNTDLPAVRDVKFTPVSPWGQEPSNHLYSKAQPSPIRRVKKEFLLVVVAKKQRTPAGNCGSDYKKLQNIVSPPSFPMEENLSICEITLPQHSWSFMTSLLSKLC